MGTIFNTEWNINRADGQDDAVWYHGLGVVGTATLEKDGKTYSLAIRCDGETKVLVPYENEDGTYDTDNVQFIRYADEWEQIGVTTDAEMQALTEKWSERGVDIWVHNSWFDAYAEEPEVDGWEHLDAVTHTIQDAEAQARAILEEVAELGGWEQYLDYPNFPN